MRGTGGHQAKRDRGAKLNKLLLYQPLVEIDTYLVVYRYVLLTQQHAALRMGMLQDKTQSPTLTLALTNSQHQVSTP
jgi:hypothetical protein